MRGCVIAVGVTVTALFVCLLFASVPVFTRTVYSKRNGGLYNIPYFLKYQLCK